MKQKSDSLKHAVDTAEVTRLKTDGPTESLTDYVVAEEVVTVMIDKVGSFTILCSPDDIEALAIGFIYSEGMIDSIDDVVTVSMKKELPNVVGIVVGDPSQIAIRRNLIIASSCGMCGTRNIEKMLSDMPRCSRTLEMSRNELFTIMEKLRSVQKIYRLTGGSHAAGIFTKDAEMISFAEDIGRHSALDKAIGKCLLQKHSMKGCAAALSGRISLEMVTKAAKAGIELIAAVSAPSSFAIKAAKKWNITLCGFIRDKKINVYTDSGRIKK